jgi:hypothetical protein
MRAIEVQVWQPVLAAAFVFCGTQSVAEITPWRTVGDWDISFYPGSNACLAYATYENNLGFFIGISNLTGNLNLEVTLLNEQWKSIESGKEYGVSVVFGNEPPWNLEMIGVQTETFHGLTFAIAADSTEAGQFADEFMREVTMSWTYGGNQMAFVTLRGSKLAFDEAVACAKSFRTANQGNGDPFATDGNLAPLDPFAN